MVDRVGRKSVRALARALGVGLVACTATLAVQARTEAQTQDADPRPARGLIVKLKPVLAQPAIGARSASADDDRLQRVLDAAGLKVAARAPVGAAAQHLDFGRVLAGAEASRLAERLRQRPEVEWVEPNVRERRLALPTPNDPGFAGTAGQWWLAPVSGSDANVIERRLRGVPGVQTAWALSKGRAAAVVAVLDTGITAHPDLTGHVLPGYDFVTDSNIANDGSARDADPSDPGDWVGETDKSNATFSDCEVEPSSWHGTKIAGLLAASTHNALGVAGINWYGRVLPVRVAGKCGADLTDIIDGMRWAAGLPVRGVTDNPNPARVINISFGGSAACGHAYQDAVDELKAVGAVVVAAAGNENGAVTRPASCTGVVGVVALNRDGFKASYSNFGPALQASGIATVGGDWRTGGGAWDEVLGDDGLYGLINQGATSAQSPDFSAGYGRVAGTSFAAPVVAGVASLMLSVNATLSADQLIEGLRLSARPHVVSSNIGACSDQNPGRCICTAQTCGVGILDADRALKYALDPLQALPRLTAARVGSGDKAAADVQSAKSMGGPQDRPANATSTDSGGGGGALELRWLLALALAVFALARAKTPNETRR